MPQCLHYSHLSKPSKDSKKSLWCPEAFSWLSTCCTYPLTLGFRMKKMFACPSEEYCPDRTPESYCYSFKLQGTRRMDQISFLTATNFFTS